MFSDRNRSADIDHAGRNLLKIKFEEFGSGEGSLADGYNHLTWDGMLWATGEIVAEVFGPSGYDRGVVSGENMAFGGVDGDVVISSGGGNFDFESTYVTAAWRRGMTVDVYGSDDGVQLYHKSFVVGDLKPSLLKLHFRDVDTVTFVASGGTKDPNVVGDGTQMVFDNIKLRAQAGSIAGTIFNDRDGDGVQDVGERGLAGRTVFDDVNGNGVLDAGEASATTDKSGAYTIAGVSFGAHTVVATTPKGWEQTSPLTDAYDYAVAESEYHWIDIAQPANEYVPFGFSDGSVSVLLSQPINFYGASEGTDVLTISVNGLASFQYDGTDLHTNTALPDVAAPNGVLAPFWDDLTLGRERTGHIYFDDRPEDELAIVEWKDLRLYGETDLSQTMTFQMIIHYDGTIEYQYQKMADKGGSATIGLENMDGTVGTQYSYNEIAVKNGSAITFTPFIYDAPTSAHVDVDSGWTTFGVDFGQQRVEAGLHLGAVPAGGAHHGAWNPIAMDLALV
jgi:hypothetical protein